MEIQLWRSILCPYELAVRELIVKFEHIISEHRENDLYSPIEQVSGRVKSVSSILEKMQRKHIPMERMEEEVEDIAGIRIICQFEEDIETVASLIQNRSDMTIKSEKNYLKHVKQSGYRSLHLIIYYTVETLNGPRKLQAEIQIRTMAIENLTLLLEKKTRWFIIRIKRAAVQYLHIDKSGYLIFALDVQKIQRKGRHFEDRF